MSICWQLFALFIRGNFWNTLNLSVWASPKVKGTLVIGAVVNHSCASIIFVTYCFAVLRRSKMIRLSHIDRIFHQSPIVRIFIFQSTQVVFRWWSLSRNKVSQSTPFRNHVVCKELNTTFENYSDSLQDKEWQMVPLHLCAAELRRICLRIYTMILTIQ